MINLTTIYSILGNNSSLIPLGIKDVSNSLGMTAGSYVTGSNAEGKDRFIDEFGTLVIWLMGVPFFKWVIDKTAYKAAGYNPNIDTRILDNPDVFTKAKEKAAQISPELVKDFEKVEKNKGLFKGMFLGRFATATLLTLGAYSWLTTTRHKHTEACVIKEIKKEEETKKANQAFMAQKTVSKTFKPSFSGLGLSSLQQFMFDPVKNTMIIDGGITTERLVDSRSPQDFLGYVIKEGGFWAFMYFAGKEIQKYFENKAAEKGHHIDLDIRVLQDKNFEKALIKEEIKTKHLDTLPKVFEEFEHNLPQKDDTTEILAAKTKARKALEPQIYEELFKEENKNNLVIQMAKKSDIIHTSNNDNILTQMLKGLGLKEAQKETEAIDPQGYINIEDVVSIKTKMAKLFEEYLKPETNKETFFNDVLNLKRKSVLKNIGACIGVLGIVIPGIMVACRYFGDNKEFQVKKELKEKLGVNA